MNKEILISYLLDPGCLNHDSIDELKELVEQYPYFQTARLLSLKALKENNSISFPAELKMTSVYAGDRTRMLKLMKQKPKSEPIFLPLKPPAQPKQTTEVLAQFVEPLLFEHIATTTPGLTIPMVDKMLEFENTSVSTTLDYQSDSPTESLHEDITPQIIDYLALDPLQAGNEKPKKQEQKNLIDSFIKKNPRIVPKEHVPPVVSDLSEESVKETDFLTETLAEIYIKQKKYDKAMQIYEKLCLKYPQKSITFADQIRKLKESIDSEKK